MVVIVPVKQAIFSKQHVSMACDIENDKLRVHVGLFPAQKRRRRLALLKIAVIESVGNRSTMRFHLVPHCPFCIQRFWCRITDFVHEARQRMSHSGIDDGSCAGC